jgi:hypothetical protein
MRTIQTYVLRLLIDSDHPEAVCGALEVLHEGEKPMPFRHEAALVALLKHLIVGHLASNSAVIEKKEKST